MDKNKFHRVPEDTSQQQMFVEEVIDNVNEINATLPHKANLNEAGKVPASELPSYVDDIVEYPTRSDFPAEGETGKIYLAKDTNYTYRWSGSEYIQVNSDPVITEENKLKVNRVNLHPPVVGTFDGVNYYHKYVFDLASLIAAHTIGYYNLLTGELIDSSSGDYPQDVSCIQFNYPGPPGGTASVKLVCRNDGSSSSIYYRWIMIAGTYGPSADYSSRSFRMVSELTDIADNTMMYIPGATAFYGELSADGKTFTAYFNLATDVIPTAINKVTDGTNELPISDSRVDTFFSQHNIADLTSEEVEAIYQGQYKYVDCQNQKLIVEVNTDGELWLVYIDEDGWPYMYIYNAGKYADYGGSPTDEVKKDDVHLITSGGVYQALANMAINEPIQTTYEQIYKMLDAATLIPGQYYDFIYTSTDLFYGSDLHFKLRVKAIANNELDKHAEVIGLSRRDDNFVDYHADVIYDPYEDNATAKLRNRGDIGYILIETASGKAYSYPAENLPQGPSGYEAYRYCFMLVDEDATNAVKVYANTNFPNVGDIVIKPDDDSPEIEVTKKALIFNYTSFTGKIKYMKDQYCNEADFDFVNRRVYVRRVLYTSVDLFAKVRAAGSNANSYSPVYATIDDDDLPDSTYSFSSYELAYAISIAELSTQSSPKVRSFFLSYLDSIADQHDSIRLMHGLKMLHCRNTAIIAPYSGYSSVDNITIMQSDYTCINGFSSNLTAVDVNTTVLLACANAKLYPSAPTSVGYHSPISNSWLSAQGVSATNLIKCAIYCDKALTGIIYNGKMTSMTNIRNETDVVVNIDVANA